MSTTKQKIRPVIGDTEWNVEWTSNIPLDENGDSDHDLAETHLESFADKESALERANHLIDNNLDAYGCVAVEEVEFVPYDDADTVEFPHAGHWQGIGELIHIPE